MNERKNEFGGNQYGISAAESRGRVKTCANVREREKLIPLTVSAIRLPTGTATRRRVRENETCACRPCANCFVKSKNPPDNYRPPCRGRIQNLYLPISVKFPTYSETPVHILFISPAVTHFASNLLNFRTDVRLF